MSFGVAVVAFNPSKAPLLTLTVAEFFRAKFEKQIKIINKGFLNDAQLSLTGADEEFNGNTLVARCLVRLLNASEQSYLYGSNPVEATKVDFFLELLSRASQSEEKKALGEVWTQLDTHLVGRNFLVGHHVTLADLLFWDVFRTQEGAEEVKGYSQLSRLFHYIEGLEPVQKTLSFLSKFQKTFEKLKESSKGGSYEIDLPDASEGKVVTRFPPEPSGYLHIGHIKAALLNDYFAKRYKGRMILRFDDTNPDAEKEEFVQAIIQDLKTLSVDWNELTHTSQYFEDIIKYGEQLLKTGKAYIDNTPVDQLREERGAGIESRCRNNSVEENFRAWKEMLAGSPEGLKSIMRAKIDMKEKNKCLRDPTLFRCSLTPHHRRGTSFKVYPTYDFACPIVDSKEGVTHTLRTSEYQDRNAQYYWVIEALDLRRPHIWDYSRLNFKYTLLSKRKLKWFVEQNRVDGWHDPRFPTVRGIMRRGMTVQGLKDFIQLQGASRSGNLMEWDKIWAINQKVIDPIAPRYTAIDKTKKVPFILNDVDKKGSTKKVPLHPKLAKLGDKNVKCSQTIWIELNDAVLIAQGEEVTLINWGNAIVEKIVKNKDGHITQLEGKTNLKGNVKTTSKKLTWLASDDTLIPLSLVEFDFLITVPKLEETDELENVLREQTRFVTEAVGESAIRDLKKGDIIQLTRRGFFICDVPLQGKESMVLFFIPDGKEKGMSILSSDVGRKQKK